MCQVLKVNRSGFYSWLNKPESKTQKENKKILKNILEIRKDSKLQNYGSLKMTKELHENNIQVGHNRVARIMKENNIKSKSKRKFKATTNSKHKLPVFENILNRNFEASEANKKFVSDITYVYTNEGWLYLCVIIDLYSRKVVGWAMDKNMKTELVLRSIEMMAKNKTFKGNVIFHSDRGVQYASKKCVAKLESLKITQSMSRKGNCWDNACAETFFHTLKTEELYHHKFKTREEAKLCIFEYIEVFYNRKRKHSTLGYMSPEKFEKKICA